MNNLFLIFNKLQEKYLTIINHITCLFYNKKQESFDYLTIYKSLNNTQYTIISNAFKKIKQKIKKYLNIKSPMKQIKKIL